ncbi:MAG: TIGR04076 family protein [Candidatus Thorarchaeota archaeon]|nr:TIGR04076 family protein [Candidatus Thorarchaeota archaeon]
MTADTCIRSEPWNILRRVRSQKGRCAEGYEEGDEILFTSNEIKGRICISALYSIIPKVYAMMYNSRFPWLKNQCIATHACPDASNPVVFELREWSRS